MESDRKRTLENVIVYIYWESENSLCSCASLSGSITYEYHLTKHFVYSSCLFARLLTRKICGGASKWRVNSRLVHRIRLCVACKFNGLHSRRRRSVRNDMRVLFDTWTFAHVNAERILWIQFWISFCLNVCVSVLCAHAADTTRVQNSLSSPCIVLTTDDSSYHRRHLELWIWHASLFFLLRFVFFGRIEFIVNDVIIRNNDKW